MRTSRAEDGKTHRKRGKRIESRGGFASRPAGSAEVPEQTGGLPDGVLSRGLHRAVLLAADPHPQAPPSAEGHQRPLDDGIQLLDHQHLVQPVEEFRRQLLREGEGRAHLEESRMLPLREDVRDIGPADALGRDADPLPFKRGGFRKDPVSRVTGESFRHGPVPRLDLSVIDQGQAREDHPAGGVLDEALGGEL